jgi:hypothetical protein
MLLLIFMNQVTYCRTPLEPIPDGNLWKRRKTEHDDVKTLPDLSEKSSSSDDEPTIKDEKEDTSASCPAPVEEPTTLASKDKAKDT